MLGLLLVSNELFNPGIPVYLLRNGQTLDDNAVGYIKSKLVYMCLAQNREPLVHCGEHGQVKLSPVTIHRRLNGQQFDSPGFVVDPATREKLRHSLEFKHIEVIG